MLRALTVALAVSAAPAAAHLTGVFAHFVEDINDPTASTRLLRQQLDSVGQRIAALQPEVQAARTAYDSQAETAVRRIRFYDIYAGSALGALWAGAQDPIDVIASSELLQRRLGDDLEALGELSRDYEQSAARDERLSRLPSGLVSPFAEPYIAYRIAEDWEQLRGTTFVLYFHWAARRIAERGLQDILVAADQSGDAWLLQEEVLNALVGGDSFPFIEDARFYLRADHVNFSARLTSALDQYELLTVGQLERTGPSGFQYRIEAIFMDGMPIDPSDPDVEREVYQGSLLGINLNTVMPEGAAVATFEQRNGSIEFRFR
jgi:hypothetical protein